MVDVLSTRQVVMVSDRRCGCCASVVTVVAVMEVVAVVVEEPATVGHKDIEVVVLLCTGNGGKVT